MIRALLALLVVIAVGAAGYLAYDRYAERYTVERDDGVAVSRVVRSVFADAQALKVGELSGTVQSSATDTRGFGLLRSDHVFKAPFTAAYFVDLSGRTADDYRWNAATRTLTVSAPEVTVGRVDVDEAGKTLTRTRGLFVTRAAQEELARRTSVTAQRVAQAEAGKPQHLMQARTNARRTLRSLFAAPLAAAGLNDVTVEVRFAADGEPNGERWDTSRSLRDVLDDPK